MSKLFWKFYHSTLGLVIQSLVTGFLVGLVIASVRIILAKTDVFRRAIYTYLRTAPPRYTIFWALFLTVLGVVVGLCAWWRPHICGGGVPEVKAHMQKKLTLNWPTELPLKWLCPILVISAGLSLGWEGPSVQIGAYIALAVLSLCKRDEASSHTLICAGSAAGLSAAFSAPLSGVLFILEEVLTSVQPLFLACMMGASVAADAAVGLFLGFRPAFDFRAVQVMDWSNYPWLILLGLLCAILGDVFKRLIYAGKDLYVKLKIPKILRPIIPLLVSIPVGFYLIDVTGGGHTLIESLTTENRALSTLVLFLVVKIAFTALCSGSGTGGGIFLPFLAAGALTGAVFSITLQQIGLMDSDHHLTMTILGMAGFFAAVVKAPVTAIVIVLEMTANMNHLNSLVTVVFSAFVASELIRSRPVYHVLLDRLTLTENLVINKRGKYELKSGSK